MFLSELDTTDWSVLKNTYNFIYVVLLFFRNIPDRWKKIIVKIKKPSRIILS